MHEPQWGFGCAGTGGSVIVAGGACSTTAEVYGTDGGDGFRAGFRSYTIWAASRLEVMCGM